VSAATAGGGRMGVGGRVRDFLGSRGASKWDGDGSEIRMPPLFGRINVGSGEGERGWKGRGEIGQRRLGRTRRMVVISKHVSNSPKICLNG
jgi:hypothetical protein